MKPVAAAAHSRYAAPYLGRMRPLSGAAETFEDPAALLDRLAASAIGALSGSCREPSPGQAAGGRLPGADLAPAARAPVARGLRLVAGPLASTGTH